MAAWIRGIIYFTRKCLCLPILRLEIEKYPKSRNDKLVDGWLNLFLVNFYQSLKNSAELWLNGLVCYFEIALGKVI